MRSHPVYYHTSKDLSADRKERERGTKIDEVDWRLDRKTGASRWGLWGRSRQRPCLPPHRLISRPILSFSSAQLLIAFGPSSIQTWWYVITEIIPCEIALAILLWCCG
jgi:hypothetical protein